MSVGLERDRRASMRGGTGAIVGTGQARIGPSAVPMRSA